MKDRKNRALSKNRPTKRKDLYEVNLENKSDDFPCKKNGHIHIFLLYDNYGYCKVCGDEVLT